MQTFPLITLALAAAAAISPAQAQMRLSLKQAVEAALAPEGNTRVQLAAEARRQAQSRSNQARAALLPNLDAYVSEQNQTRNLAAFGIQIHVPIPGFSFPTLAGPFSVFDARVQATQSVFDFSAIRRLQASRAGTRASEADIANARDQVSAQVASLYMQVLAAQAHVEAAEANVSLAEATAKLAENRKNAGTGTGIEVTRALVEVANARQLLLVAQTGERQAKLQLLRAIGLRLETQLDLTDKLAYTPVDDVPLKQSIETAFAARADWRAQKTREDNARLNYSATKFERLPSVSAFGDYGSIGTGMSSAIPTRTYGVQMRVPVFDGGRRDARRAESLSQLRQEQIRSGDLRQQVELEIRLALDSLRSAEDQLKAAEEGLQQAEREVAQSQRRYDAGVANSLEPIDAQARLARARDNRIAALLNYNLARINLSQATGAIRQVIQ
ncbi:MAG: TolC family protein [Acidobacteriota bacterium]